MDIIFPPALKEGDRIAILAPAGIANPDNVHGAIHLLNEQGWDAYACPHTFDRHGIYAGTAEARAADLKEALTDPSVRAIMCARGGYGVVHLLEELSQINLREDPKWVIGFSDITALLALMASQGVAGIHSHMTSHLTRCKGADDDSIALFDILYGHRMVYDFHGNSHNRPGSARARLLGGNFSVLAGLIGTPFDSLLPGSILFLEDVSEPVYKIERIFYQLRLSGVLGKLKGLIIGQFTKASRDADGESMEQMIARMVAPYDYPVAFDAPIGHVSHNIPLITSAPTTLDVTTTSVQIDQRNSPLPQL